MFIILYEDDRTRRLEQDACHRDVRGNAEYVKPLLLYGRRVNV